MKIFLLTLMLSLPVLAMSEEIEMPLPIKEVKARHAARLIILPGVVSIGIGRDEKGQPAIIVGLERSIPETEAQLPVQLEGYPVKVQILGRMKAQ
jgi:hypothetical protein